jgi:hypothetical protein
MVNVGDTVKFQYVELKESGDRWNVSFPRQTECILKDYVGEVVKIRDIYEDPLAWRTLKTHPEVLRSQYLITVHLHSGHIKAFYSGRLVNVEHFPLEEVEPLRIDETPVKQVSFVKRMLTMIGVGV